LDASLAAAATRLNLFRDVGAMQIDESGF